MRLIIMYRDGTRFESPTLPNCTGTLTISRPVEAGLCCRTVRMSHFGLKPSAHLRGCYGVLRASRFGSFGTVCLDGPVTFPWYLCTREMQPLGGPWNPFRYLKDN